MTVVSSPTTGVATRLHLSPRQLETLAELLDAAEVQLRTEGPDALTLRSVAAAAGVTHTTVYNYFSSKSHLVAEMLHRKLEALPDPDPSEDHSFEDRVRLAIEGPGLMLRDNPQLAQAALAALVTSDPEVARLRNQVGDELIRRIRLALGDEVDQSVSGALMICLSGALFQAGMGYFDCADIVDNVLSVVRILDR